MHMPLLLLVSTLLLTVGGVPRAAPPDYSGEYGLASGGVLSVVYEGAVTEAAQLILIDWLTGRVGPLQGDGTDEFIVPTNATPTRVTFVRDEKGTVTRMLLVVGDAPAVPAERIYTYIDHAVSFKANGTCLTGTLKVPIGTGPFPAVVLIHGSGPGTREQVESMSRFFSHQGMAVLSFDKRGCGGSSGDWKTASFNDLAGDVLAGVAFLRERSDIDPDRVGLWGISQGGWIGPLAAARSDHIAFVINHSGPGTTPRRQDVYMTSRILAMQDVPAADIEYATSALNAMYDYGQGRASAADLDATLEVVQGKPGLEDFEGLSSRNVSPDSMYALQPMGDPAWFFHIDPDHDALTPYRRLDCPVLVVYGRLDYTVPVIESASLITRALQQREHPDYTVEIIDETGHGMLVMDPAAPFRPVTPLTQSHEYFDLLESWLTARGFTN